MTDTSTEPTEDEAAVGLGDFFGRLYAVTYSKAVGLAVILVFAVLILAGVIFQQAPEGVWADPAARAAFLTKMATQYGGWAGLLGALGLFHVFTSIGFYVVSGALAVSILGCTTHRIPQLWQRWRHPRTLVSPRFFTAARYRAEVDTGLDAEGGLKAAARGLKEARHRVVPADDRSFYADRFAWGGFGTVVAHLGFIVILAAFVISGTGSYATVLNVPIGGASVPVGHGTDLAVAVTTYDEAFDQATGKPTDYVSHVVVSQGGQQVVERDVRVNTPLEHGGWAFHQYSPRGLAIEVRAVGADGATLFEGAVPQDHLSNDGTLAIGVFRVESLGVEVQVETPASGTAGLKNSLGLRAGQAAFLVFPDGATSPSNMSDLGSGGASVAPGASYTHKDLTLTFLRESHYTGIRVRTDPGTVWVWVGGVFLVVGMTVTFACRQRRYWVRAEDGRLLLASADKEDPGFRQDFVELTRRARTWYADTLE